MNAGLTVGSSISHRRYGSGKVLGLSEKKEVVRIRFERAGVKELPYPDPDLTACPGESAGVASLRFEGGSGGPGCRWMISFSDAAVCALVNDISTWASGKAKLNGARVRLMGAKEGRMELTIAGHGRDGRCRWCRTFRSALKTALRRDYGRGALACHGSCVFDAAPGSGGTAAVRIGGG